MSEQTMIAAFQAALTDHGVNDQVTAVGQFAPRGQVGGMFVGGFAGGGIGGAVGGELGDAVGVGFGALAGRKAHDAASGLPSEILVGVSPTMVYGFAAKSRSKPTEPVFGIPREHLEVKVHQRVNVKILELIHTESGSQIQLEGNRIPITHSKDVFEALND